METYIQRQSLAPGTPLTQALRAMSLPMGISFFFSFFINILALVAPVYMLQVYDRVLSSRSQETLVFITLIAIFLFVVASTLEVFRSRVLVRAGVSFDRVLRIDLFSSALDAALQHRPGGPQAFRDADMLREFLTGAGLITICDVPWIPVFVIVSFFLHPFFGVLALISGAIILGLAIVNDVTTRRPIERATVASIAAQGDVSATLRNSEVMQAMGMWGGLRARWQSRRDELIGWQASASDRGGGAMATVKMARQIVQTLILGGGAFLAIKGQISPGVMIAASILVGRALAPIEGAVGQWKSFIGARGAWERLQSLFLSARGTPPTMPLPAPRGELSVEGVTVVAPGQNIPTVIGASFRLEPCTTLAVIGPSAAGKSSLLRALVGVWPTATGVVRIDGFDLRHWDREQLGPYIGYLPQDVELFSGTVAENIARFGPVASEDVIEAARLAGIHEMVQSLPHGYGTQVGEGGAALSGGQRQRLALARTLYRRPSLIVMDEPNSSLDTHGEQALARAISILKPQSTIVLVTHREGLLALADKVAVMHAGRILKFESPESLMRGAIPRSAPLAAHAGAAP